MTIHSRLDETVIMNSKLKRKKVRRLLHQFILSI